LQEQKPLAENILWDMVDDYVSTRASAKVAQQYEKAFLQHSDYLANAFNIDRNNLTRHIDPSVLAVSDSVYTLNQDSLWDLRKARFSNLGANVMQAPLEPLDTIQAKQRNNHAREMIGQMSIEPHLGYHLAEMTWHFYSEMTLDPAFIPKSIIPSGSYKPKDSLKWVGVLSHFVRGSRFVAESFQSNVGLLLLDPEVDSGMIKNPVLRDEYNRQKLDLLMSGDFSSLERKFMAPPNLPEQIRRSWGIQKSQEKRYGAN
jgi:hypothetical protein